MDRHTEIFKEFFQTVGDEIAAVHLKDIVFENGEKKWRNIGKGIVRYDMIFEWLNANKTFVPLLREHVMPESCHADIEAMKRLAGI